MSKKKKSKRAKKKKEAKELLSDDLDVSGVQIDPDAYMRGRIMNKIMLDTLVKYAEESGEHSAEFIKELKETNLHSATMYLINRDISNQESYSGRKPKGLSDEKVKMLESIKKQSLDTFEKFGLMGTYNSAQK